ncbi:MAG: hypothetical protein AAF802_15450 [Planctomycetota bacterium]
MNHLSIEDRLELLVADCLSPSEESALLTEIEAHPDHFRTLSMLFLEDRKWRVSFAECQEPVDVKTATDSKNPAWWSSPVISLVAAACLTCAFFLGRGLQPIQTNAASPTITMFEPTNLSNDLTRDESIAVDFVDGDEVVLGIAEWDSRFGHQATPLFDLDAAIPNEQLVAAAPDPILNIPSAMQRDLRRAGWSIEQTFTHVKIRLVGGQRLSLPLTDYQYRFVGRDVY